jgi:hypothetical protein
MNITRKWAMPSADTFDVPPIGEFVKSYLRKSKVSIDPFARNKRWATYTNDLNPDTAAEYHMDAADFLEMLVTKGVKVDLIIFDPPYSPRQIKECYDGIGIKMQQNEAMRGEVFSRYKRHTDNLLEPGGVVLWCGWNSNGMGKKYNYAILEILLVAHGSDHNDTICMAEWKLAHQPSLLEVA